jgi:hypothetical protein
VASRGNGVAQPAGWLDTVYLTDSPQNLLDNGTVSYDVSLQNTGFYNLFLPLVLVLDPAQGFTGIPENASQASNGSWRINLAGAAANGVALAPGQITTGQTLTINDPNQFKVACTPDVSGTPAGSSAPVFDSAPVTAVSAGAAYRYQIQAHDPDGSTPSYLLYGGPAGMTLDPTTGLLTWDTLPTSPASVSVYSYDPSGSSARQQFTLAVAGGSHAPVLGPLPPQVFGQEGRPLVLPVSATDPDGRSSSTGRTTCPAARRLTRRRTHCSGSPATARPAPTTA